MMNGPETNPPDFGALTWRVGMMVACIDDRWSLPPRSAIAQPVKGIVYTIRYMIPYRCPCCEERLYFLLEEIRNPRMSDGFEPCFGSLGFKPVTECPKGMAQLHEIPRKANERAPVSLEEAAKLLEEAGLIEICRGSP
jgi:hypothetical protein